MIYLDSAATSYYRPKEVSEAVIQAIETMGSYSRGTHGAALNAARVIEETRQLLSDLFHADGPEQVAFTANATESLNLAIKGILQPGDHAVTTVLEHNSVLRPLYEMEGRGVSLSVIGCDRNGVLHYDEIEDTVRENTRVVVCTHASNLTGNLADIRRIGRLCREKGILFVADAAQTAGIFPIDMQSDNIDILCFTGHKSLLGPQGTGGICIRKGIEVKPLLSGGSGIATYSRKHPSVLPAALEAGTLNGHGIAGLKAGLEYIFSVGLGPIRQREQQLAWEFYQEVKKIPEVRIYGDYSNMDRAPVVALNVGELDSGEVSDRLAETYEICTRPGAHCAPLMHRALGTEKQGAVRFSFSHFNTTADVSSAVSALRELAG